MACCAFAAFIISQIVLAIDGLRRRLGMTEIAPALNPNAAWRLDAPQAALAQAATGFRIRASALAFVAVLVVAGAGIGAAWDASAQENTMRAFMLICTKDGAVTLAEWARNVGAR